VAVTQDTLRQAKRLRQQLITMTDAQTVELTRAWAEAWDVLLPEFEAALSELLVKAVDGKVSHALAARNVRLQAALRAAREALDVLAPRSADIITQELSWAVLDAAEGHQALVKSQLPPAHTGVTVTFNRVPHDALTAIVERTTQQIHSNFKPLAADVERKMKRALVRGIAVGDNPRTTASKLMRETEGAFNGGLTRALNISRTETLDAHRAGAKAAERANLDILTEWEWHANLDRRTCPSCLAKHGQRFPLEDDGPQDHQQGRCARVPITKTWKELGFDIPEPASVTPDSRQWFDNLTPETQREIMGPARLKLLNDGDIAWADLSSKHSTAGWRDSYVVTPLKDLVQ
jgi:hypothetical protein